MPEKPRLGKLPPMYNFILNPHAETRVSRCPSCEARMRQRKVPLFIHVEPMHPVAIGYTCRYCPDCDLLVAHQDEIEHLLANLFAERDPSAIGNDYLVMGTLERTAWRASLKEPMSTVELLEQLHDFKQVWSLDYRPAGWYRERGRGRRPGARQGPSAVRRPRGGRGPDGRDETPGAAGQTAQETAR